MARDDQARMTGEAAASMPARADAHPATRVRARAAGSTEGCGGHGAALKFIGRVAQLDLDALGGILATWRRSMRRDADAWFAAEEAVGRAVVASARQQDQKPLLMHIADAFAHLVWYGGRMGRPPGEPAPELRVQASEASGQYLATLAMLAVLVRDHLDPSAFALLYEPFAPHIPLAALMPE